jgi:hypothetical protein
MAAVTLTIHEGKRKATEEPWKFGLAACRDLILRTKNSYIFPYHRVFLYFLPYRSIKGTTRPLHTHTHTMQPLMISLSRSLSLSLSLSLGYLQKLRRHMYLPQRVI